MRHCDGQQPVLMQRASTGVLHHRPSVPHPVAIQATPISMSTAPGPMDAEDAQPLRHRAQTDSSVFCSSMLDRAAVSAAAASAADTEKATCVRSAQAVTAPVGPSAMVSGAALAARHSVAPSGPMLTGAATVIRTRSPPPQPLTMTYVAAAPAASPMPSPLASPSLSFVRTTSSGTVPGSPRSPAWTTVQQPKRRGPREPKQSVAAAATAQTEVGQAPPARTAGDCVDLAYDQKDFFMRSGRRDAKQSWSVKAKKRTEYQVDKRKQQRERQIAANAGFEFDSDEG